MVRTLIAMATVAMSLWSLPVSAAEPRRCSTDSLPAAERSVFRRNILGVIKQKEEPALMLGPLSKAGAIAKLWKAKVYVPRAIRQTIEPIRIPGLGSNQQTTTGKNESVPVPACKLGM